MPAVLHESSMQHKPSRAMLCDLDTRTHGLDLMVTDAWVGPLFSCFSSCAFSLCMSLVGCAPRCVDAVQGELAAAPVPCATGALHGGASTLHVSMN
eukprot:5112299-Prymnesium_polylepis.2